MYDEFEEDAGPVERLPTGKIFGKRWKILSKLDDGSCGSVYLVEDLISRRKAALKAEPNLFVEGSFLKFEVQVLKRMQGRNCFAQLIKAGKKKTYSYMIMTLFGDNLSSLFKQCNNEFSVGTQVRLGMQVLYGLRQLHDHGYIHRDIKPSNLAVGKNGSKARIVHLLDFGLVRKFIRQTNGKLEMRRPREAILFRGTTKYCSASMHLRSEQGRSDDLWSMVYMLVEMRGSLPWSQLRNNNEIKKLKMTTNDEELLSKCPPQMLIITEHLRSLDYYSRPNYQHIFETLQQILDDYDVKHSDPYDWETSSKKSSKFRRKSGNAAQPIEDQVSALPFSAEDFSKNELGL